MFITMAILGQLNHPEEDVFVYLVSHFHSETVVLSKLNGVFSLGLDVSVQYMHFCCDRLSHRCVFVSCCTWIVLKGVKWSHVDALEQRFCSQ